MKVQAVKQQAPQTLNLLKKTNNTSNVNFKAYIYKPVQKPCLADANPVLWHFNKIFTQSMNFAKKE